MLKARPLIEGWKNASCSRLLSVSNTADSGGGSLRDAINKANSSSGADMIQFKIGSGLKTIAPTSGLPQLTGPTTLDGTTQGGYAGKPLIEIRGDQRRRRQRRHRLSTGGSSTVKGLVINRFGAIGILVINKGGNTIKNCYIGTDASGTAAAGNGQKGIILQSSGNTVGGTSSADRNVISGNVRRGIQFYTSAASGNKILGNYIGTDATGTKAHPQRRSGVAIHSAASNTIGGTQRRRAQRDQRQRRTTASSSTAAGAKYNVIMGNYIGTNAAGTAKLGNGDYGIEISAAQQHRRRHQPPAPATSSAATATPASSCGSASGIQQQGDRQLHRHRLHRHQDLGNAWRGVDITNGSSNNLDRRRVGRRAQRHQRQRPARRPRLPGQQQPASNGNYIGLAANGTSSPRQHRRRHPPDQDQRQSTSGNKIGNNGAPRRLRQSDRDTRTGNMSLQ